jgi:hypothetical protein
MTARADYCFGTLALGPEFVEHAVRLAGDFATYAPTMSLVVLTDDPDRFRRFAMVAAVAHRQASAIRCYHDKRLVLAEALRHYRCCVYLDADCRLLAPLPTAWLSALRTGFGGQPALSIEAKLAEDISDEVGVPRRALALNPAERRRALVHRAARRLGVDVTRARFVPEQLFALSRCEGREQAFLDVWKQLSVFFELRGFSWGEGLAIGLAVARAQLERFELPSADSWLFKDVFVHRQRARGESVTPRQLELLAERESLSTEFRARGARKHFRRARDSIAVAYRYSALATAELLGRAPSA